MQYAGGFFILKNMSKNRRNEIIACFGILVTAFIWGVAFVVVKNSLDYIPPIYMVALRFTLASICLGLVFAKKFAHLTGKIILHSFYLGLMLFLAYSFQTIGLNHTTAGKNAFLTTVYMILVPFVNIVFTRVRPAPKAVFAAIVAFVGIGLISLSAGDFGISLGDGLTLICGFFFAVQIVLVGKYAVDEDPALLTVGQLFFTALLAWISAPFLDGRLTADMFNSDSVFGILFLGIMSTAVANLLQNVSQRYAPAGPASILMSMESVFGAISGVIFLGEIMTGQMIAGCLLMLVAIFLVEVDITSPFFPDEYLDSAYNIDYEKLYAEGIRGIIYDIDNTLVEHGFPADERACRLMKRLDEIGFKIVFLSNNKEPRVKSFRDKALANADYIFKAGKPGKKGYLKAMEIMNTDTDSTIFIGDQLFTDVWGAKRAGIKNILTMPIDKKEEIQIILKRRLEHIVLSDFKKTDAYTQKPHELIKNS